MESYRRSPGCDFDPNVEADDCDIHTKEEEEEMEDVEEASSVGMGSSECGREGVEMAEDDDDEGELPDVLASPSSQQGWKVDNMSALQMLLYYPFLDKANSVEQFNYNNTQVLKYPRSNICVCVLYLYV